MRKVLRPIAYGGDERVKHPEWGEREQQREQQQLNVSAASSNIATRKERTKSATKLTTAKQDAEGEKKDIPYATSSPPGYSSSPNSSSPSRAD